MSVELVVVISGSLAEATVSTVTTVSVGKGVVTAGLGADSAAALPDLPPP
eukprot:CAMPEP_0201942792 /NCGR_PEP_ID=MMETSP0903-20130614/49718_1 /ASSEMBLY_ACC=CAM_ASM_000552 /TAXON_ID=420261 /ORGANISM="Thalassiosira antarctica, Strain CCMP982" /LENGTH=49 /DNA_ID=CAMNT_0048485283 /DNA_START=51 /DNA_END=200 /DNA_ORIENTATION=+